MKCIIVDDELSSRIIIERLCEDYPELEVPAQFSNGLEGLKYVNPNQVDVVFLDIHMPLISGIDFIQTIQNPPKIVFTTSDKNFAIEAYEYDFIVDYIVKPVTQERFSKTIKKLKKELSDLKPETEQNLTQSNLHTNDEIYINIDRRLIKLKLSEILMVEASGDYIDIKTMEKQYRVHTTMKKIKEKLPESVFMQIHRSYIINFTKIIDIQDNTVLIERNVIPISRSQRPQLMERLNLL